MRIITNRIGGSALLVLLFVATLPLVTPRVRGADEIEYFSYLHSMFFDGDLEFGNEYQYFIDRDPQGLAGFQATFMDAKRLEPLTGRHINFGPIGSALLWSPAYLLVHGGVLIARAAGRPVVADGLSAPYEAAACYASAIYGFVGLLLIHDALRRWGGGARSASTMSVVTLWFGSPVLYYVTIAPGFSHACSLFAVSLMFWLWLRAREKSGLVAWLLVGAAGGVAGLVREQDLFFLAVPACDVAIRSWREKQLLRGGVRIALMAATASATFVPQLLAYHAINGTLLPTKSVANKMNFCSPHALQVLFDPGHGLFVWTPILFIATVGLVVALVRQRQAVMALWLVAFASQVWINGSVGSWTQAGAFGARRFVGTTMVFAWGLALVFSFLLQRRRRAAAVALTLVAVWWNVSLMVQFGLKLMNRQGLEWPRVAVNQFAAVPPRVFHTAVLFIKDRERLVRETR